MRHRKKILGILGTCVCLGLALCLCLRILLDALNPFDDLSFTPVVWQSAGLEKRTLMAQDLIDNHLKRGTSKAAVVTLLGTPDAVEKNISLKWGEETVVYPHALRYELGDSGDVPFHMDGMYVLVLFDGQEKMIAVYILQS